MSRTGPQPLRGLPGGMFQPQQSTTGRSGALGSSRLQNGKIASTSGWGSFGLPIGGAPGLSGAQSRPNATSLSGFTQSLAGSQSNLPLDLSEFPSLSGAPQTQQQSSSSQSLWANPNLRATQQTPVQRPQNQVNAMQTSSAQPTTHQSQLLQPHAQDESSVGGTAQLNTGLDDYRFGGQGGVGQLSGHAQPQSSTADEFPPLGGNAANNGGQDRRTGIIQSAAHGGGQSGGGFGMSGSTDGPQDRGLTSPIMSGIPPAVAPPADSAVSKNARTQSNASLSGFQPSQLLQRPAAFQDQQTQPIGRQPQQQRQMEQEFTSNDSAQASESAQKPTNLRLSEMSELDRFGLAGLLAMIPSDSPDYSSFAIGQDLTVLGLDLNRPDNSPLYPTFGTPFSNADDRPVIPEFTLPPAYTVTNVPPLHTKMSSFSDETLFMIFYQYPRDIMQEIAAGELYSRDWRWHKELRQWMMKDTNYGMPVRISDKQERGYYVFFDVHNWTRERREFILNYDHLDQRHGPAHP